MAPSLRSRGAPQQSFSVQLQVSQDDLRDLVKAINKHGDRKAIRKELRDGLRDAVRPLVPEARREVTSQSAKRKTRGARKLQTDRKGNVVISKRTGQATWRTSGLRKDIARAVQMKVDLGVTSDRIGVRIRLDGSKMHTHPASLVAYYEGVKKWRHPVFGDRKTWVQQPHRGFLTEVADRNRPAVGRKIEATMADIGRKIDKG